MARARKLSDWQAGDDGDDDRMGTAEIETIVPPVVVSVLLTCPNCDAQETIAAKLQTRVTKDSDGTGALALRVRSPKASHVCGQVALGLVEGSRER